MKAQDGKLKIRIENDELVLEVATNDRVTITFITLDVAKILYEKLGELLDTEEEQ